MPLTETQIPTRNDFMQATQRCAAAYLRVMAHMPKNCLHWTRDEFQYKAFLAFAAELPILCDLASFQLYMACIAQGAAVGAIDPVDVGRFCHIAQTAMSAWKLANLIVPAAREKERKAQANATPLPPKGNQSAQKQSQSQPQQPPRGEETATPLPTKGNQAKDTVPPYDDWEDLYAVTKLPSWETQVELFQSLRDRGIEIPTDRELRDNPADALRRCETALYFQKCQQSSAEPPSQQPAKEQAQAD